MPNWALEQKSRSHLAEEKWSHRNNQLAAFLVLVPPGTRVAAGSLPGQTGKQEK